jgi:hypothetical protein
LGEPLNVFVVVNRIAGILKGMAAQGSPQAGGQAYQKGRDQPMAALMASVGFTPWPWLASGRCRGLAGVSQRHAIDQQHAQQGPRATRCSAWGKGIEVLSINAACQGL